MGSSSRKKILPPILIVEGFWGVGKTTLVNAIRNLSPWPALFIKEPQHLKGKLKSDIEAWYRKQHDRNWKYAVEQIKSKGPVILERSILSSIAFYYAVHGRLPHWAYLAIRRMKFVHTDFKVLFLYGTTAFLKMCMETVSDRTVIDAACRQSNFISNYIHFYKYVLPDRFAISPFLVRVDQNGSFRKKHEIRFDLACSFQNLEVKNAVCAACVAYYKDKILLLYDKAYKHHVLPQGHKKKGEQLSLTAVRELREETGFTDVSVLKKIASYQYCYPKVRFIVRKKIHVYLLRINSLKKQPKKLEAHENYKNVFVDKRRTAEKLYWEQDKEIITKSLPFIK